MSFCETFDKLSLKKTNVLILSGLRRNDAKRIQTNASYLAAFTFTYEIVTSVPCNLRHSG